MSLKNDIMYPFGDPLTEMFSEREMTAINNVLTLAHERVWFAEGKPINLEYGDCNDMMTIEDVENAKVSVSVVQSVLIKLRQHNNDL